MKYLISSLLVFSQVSLAQSYPVENIKIQKGYVLSIDLFNKKCPKIWTKQIPEFKKNNPSVKDPNKLSINQDLKVQNCLPEKQAEEKALVLSPVAKESLPSKEDKKDYFIILSKQFNKVNAKDGDSEKTGDGYKIDVGAYFKMKEEELLKLSLGYSKNESKYDKISFTDLSMENYFLSLDASYLFQFKSFLVGPDLMLLYSHVGSSFEEGFHEDKQLSPFLGVNGIYNINKTFGIDLKLVNRVEDRLNLWGTIGLEIRF